MTTAQTGIHLVKSANRALEIIDHISDVGSATFNEIIEALALPRSSAHGLMQTLVTSGWLEQHQETRRFTLGLRTWQIGQRYDGHRLLVEKAKPIMDDLCLQTGETVQLARLDGIENVYIAISQSPNPMRLASTVGMRLHAHATGIGKALLSTLNPDEVERRLSSVALPRLTERTTTDVSELAALVERARYAGYAIDDEEFIGDCRCVAVPLTTQSDTGIASAMSITMPTHRTDSSWPYSLYAPLSQAVIDIRASMGLSAPISI